MKRFTALLATTALCVALAAPALAGGGEKCTKDAQACLNSWAKDREHGWVGFYLDKSEKDGAYTITGLYPKSPAEGAGFMTGDILIALNGVKMGSDENAMKKVKGDWKPGQSVAYTINRSGKEMTIDVTLAEMPEEVFASMLGQHLLQNHVTVAQAKAEKN